MKIPSTEDSLYDGSRTLHQFTDPPSSSWNALPSSPPPVDVPMMDDIEMDVDTDMDTDADTDEPTWQTTYVAQNQNTLRTFSNAAKAVAKRSFSIETDTATFVQRVIDNPDDMIDNKGVLTVNFEQCGLYNLPEDFGDLRMVIPRPQQMMMFLAKNTLRNIPSYIFDMSSITVLSLRDNQLKSIPPAIMKLSNLKELHIGGNQIRYLPYELTKLPLNTLTCIPNPFISPKSVDKGSDSQFVAEEYHLSERPPSLLEISAAQYIEFRQLQFLSKLPEHLRLYIETHDVQQQQCSLCQRVYIYEAARIIRWLSIFRQSCLPFKLGFCSTECYLRYAFPHSSDTLQD